MSKRKRENTTPDSIDTELPSFDLHVPGEYDTPHQAGAQALWAWEEYNRQKPKADTIFQFLNI